jgi:hypothetical protein
MPTKARRLGGKTPRRQGAGLLVAPVVKPAAAQRPAPKVFRPGPGNNVSLEDL